MLTKDQIKKEKERIRNHIAKAREIIPITPPEIKLPEGFNPDLVINTQPDSIASDINELGIVKLITTWSDGSTGQCTGFISGDQYLTTSAHCIINNSTTGKSNITCTGAEVARADEAYQFLPKYMAYPQAYPFTGSIFLDMATLVCDEKFPAEAIIPISYASVAPDQGENFTAIVAGYPSGNYVKTSIKAYEDKDNDRYVGIDINNLLLPGASGSPWLFKFSDEGEYKAISVFYGGYYKNSPPPYCWIRFAPFFCRNDIAMQMMDLADKYKKEINGAL